MLSFIIVVSTVSSLLARKLLDLRKQVVVLALTSAIVLTLLERYCSPVIVLHLQSLRKRKILPISLLHMRKLLIVITRRVILLIVLSMSPGLLLRIRTSRLRILLRIALLSPVLTFMKNHKLLFSILITLRARRKRTMKNLNKKNLNTRVSHGYLYQFAGPCESQPSLVPRRVRRAIHSKKLVTKLQRENIVKFTRKRPKWDQKQPKFKNKRSKTRSPWPPFPSPLPNHTHHTRKETEIGLYDKTPNFKRKKKTISKKTYYHNPSPRRTMSPPTRVRIYYVFLNIDILIVLTRGNDLKGIEATHR